MKPRRIDGRRIEKLWLSGVSMIDLGCEYNVTLQSIEKILRRRLMAELKSLRDEGGEGKR